LQGVIEIKEQIRQRVDLVELISEHTALKRRGANYVGLCPFHQEKTPSFSVNPERGFFKCFGCGAGGDVFTFVQLRESLEFREALQVLADRAGVTLTPTGQERSGVNRADLAKVNDWACGFFRNQLRDNKLGAQARDYLQSRGVTQETVDRFEIGLASTQAPSLEQTARRAGISPAALVAAGLRRISEDSHDHYDTFRDRLMFPIRDAMKRYVGFGGRTLVDAKAKYLNTPETAQFDKSRVVYGIHLARDAMVESHRVAVVEGYFDCIAAHQHGFRNTVATLGTAATEAQMLMLRRYCDEMILVFDSDAAGQAAADRALAIGLKQNLKVRLVRIPGEKDPADYLQAIGPQGFSHLLNSAEDALRFCWIRTSRRFQSDATAGERKAAVAEFVNLVAELCGYGVLDAIQRGIVVGQLADLLSVSTRQVQALLEKKSGPAGRANQPAEESSPIRGRPGDVEQAALVTILGVLVNEPGYFNVVADVFRPERLADPSVRRVAETIRSLADSSGEFSFGELMARVENTQDAAFVTDLIARHPRGLEAEAQLHEARRRLLVFADAAETRDLTRPWKEPGANGSYDSSQRDELAEASRKLKRLASGPQRFVHERAVQECAETDDSV